MWTSFEQQQKHIKIEKERARALRRSVWWQRKVAKEGVCHYCGINLHHDEVTMDHIVPVARGGKSQASNVVVCCKACNTNKRDLTAYEWGQS